VLPIDCLKIITALKLSEKFEDTKEVIRSRAPTMDRQYNTMATGTSTQGQNIITLHIKLTLNL